MAKTTAVAETKTPLDKKQIKTLASLGITAVSEEGARKKVLAELAKSEITGVDDDSLEDIIDMLKTLKAESEPEEETTEEEAATEEEETYDEAAEEEADEEEDEEEEEEEEEEDEAPAATVKKTVAKAPPAKAAPAAKAVTKAAPKAAAKTTTPRLKGEPFSSANAEHVKALINPVKKAYPDLEIKVLKQGYTAFQELTSAKRALFGFDRVKLVDGEWRGDFFLNAMKGLEEVQEHVDLGELDAEFKNFNPNLIFIPRVTQADIDTILEANDLLAYMKGKAEAADKRAVANRKKMEETMTTKAAAAKPAVKGAPVAKTAVKAPVKGAPVVPAKAAPGKVTKKA